MVRDSLDSRLDMWGAGERKGGKGEGNEKQHAATVALTFS